MSEKPATLFGNPDFCNICHTTSTKDEVIDGASRIGWAWMCKKCHKEWGYGLGTGKGQHFIKKDNQWYKINS